MEKCAWITNQWIQTQRPSLLEVAKLFLVSFFNSKYAQRLQKTTELSKIVSAKHSCYRRRSRERRKEQKADRTVAQRFFYFYFANDILWLMRSQKLHKVRTLCEGLMISS